MFCFEINTHRKCKISKSPVYPLLSFLLTEAGGRERGAVTHMEGKVKAKVLLLIAHSCLKDELCVSILPLYWRTIYYIKIIN